MRLKTQKHSCPTLVKANSEQAYGRQRLITILPWGRNVPRNVASTSLVKTFKLIKLSKRKKAINVLAQQALTPGQTTDTANKSQLLFPNEPQSVGHICMCSKARIVCWLILHVFCLFSASHTLLLVKRLTASPHIQCPNDWPERDKGKKPDIFWIFLQGLRGNRDHIREVTTIDETNKRTSLIPKYLLKLWPESHVDARVLIQLIKSSNYFLWTVIRKCHA